MDTTKEEVGTNSGMIDGVMIDTWMTEEGMIGDWTRAEIGTIEIWTKVGMAKVTDAKISGSLFVPFMLPLFLGNFRLFSDEFKF